MAAPVILVEARPRRAIDGAPVLVRLAGGGADFPYTYGEQHWRAGITSLPKSVARLDFDGEQLGGGGVGQALELRWAASSDADLAAMTALYWTDAPIVVRIGPEGNMPPVVAAGLVLDAAADGGVLVIALVDQTADLKRSLLVDRYAGTGGIEGPSEFKDQIKARAWGRCFNVVGRPIDTANNIWVFGDPTRPWDAFVQVRDMGAAADAAALTTIGWKGSAAATFAALQAAPAVAGGGVLAPSIACVKWWTTPGGDLHADIRGETAGGYVETVPEIVARIVAARSAIPMAAGIVAAAAAIRPAAAGWRIDNDNTTAADAISELVGGVSLSWLIADGAVTFRAWDWTASTRIARSHDVDRRSTTKPLSSRKLGYRRNWSPMARGDIAAIVFARDVIYEDGTPVRSAIDAAAKSALWGNVSGTGRPIDFADVTAVNIASGFAGQGQLATQNSLGYGSPYLTGFGALAPLGSIAFGSSYLLEQAGGVSAGLSAFKTALGIASAIAGQGAFATISTAGYGSSLLTGFGALAPLASIAFGSSYLRTSGGGTATDVLYQTGLGTAAGIAGQGAFATISSAGYGSSLLTGFGALAPLASIAFGSSFLRTGSGATATDGAYQTALGVASAVTGQGQWATYSATAPAKLEGIAPRATAGDNLVQNPMFGADTSGWNLGQNTVRVARAAGDPAPFIRGTGNNSGANMAAYAPLSIGQQTLFFSFWRRGSSFGAQLAFDMSFLDAAGNYVGGERINNFGAAYLATTATTTKTLPVNVWGLVSGSITVPFGAAQVAIATTMVPGGSDTMDLTAFVLSTSEQSVARNAKVASSDVGAGAGDNLIVNGDFLDGLNNFEVSNPALTVKTGTVDGEPSRFVRLSGASGDASLSSKAAYPTNFPIEAGKPVFMSARIRGSRAGMQVQFSVICFSSTIGYLGAGIGANAFTTAANTWETVEFAGVTPAMAAFAQVQILLVSPGAGATIDLGSWRLANTQRGATLGADVATNVRDAGTLLSRTALITTLGTASAIAGQGALATKNKATYGSDLTGYPYPVDPANMTIADGALRLPAAGMVYANGAYVQNLQPRQAGADATSTNVAAGILGQGAFATVGALRREDIGNPGNAWFTANAFSLGYTLTRQDGASILTESLAITQYGTAAGFTGQGALATKNKATYGSDLTGYPYPVDPANMTMADGALRLPAAGMVYANGAYVQNLQPRQVGADATSTNTAAAIAGQSSWATYGGLSPTNVAAQVKNLQTDGAMSAQYIYQPNVGQLSSFFPAEGGSNRTETHTSAGILGQGAFATVGTLRREDIGNPGNSWFSANAFSLGYTIRREDGSSVVTESLAITQYGVAAGFAGQGALATKNQAGAADIAPSSVQIVTYEKLQTTIVCPVGN